ncbi:MAG TPA: protein kinase [Bryobacteraceae bacterium]|nr:protein kinase [Bryobacteraceae bacterium]
MGREAEDLFHELADLSPAQRQIYFDERQVPPEVRAEVEELLRFDVGSDHSLTESVAAGAEHLLNGGAEIREGSRCGPYRLLGMLGRGGMGSVYLAERADGEVEQKVAVKFVRFGNDEPAFSDRFLRERQILATLSHPGIARLLDAGHSGDGRPYLVMEYIDGRPIDEYAQKLGLREKLKLFVQVCEAVSHAHRNLVIHRDIKPSNILVEKGGQPKLLDFGIAKMLEPGQDQTQTGEWLLTPEYASPEQVRGAAQTTATDLYSLAAVLYKLLTGSSPHAGRPATREELVTAICSKEPALPSRLKSDIPRDVDFILSKALRKEPQERYPSVEAFAEDLRAFLEWRPVRARSGGAWYRMRRFARRYRWPVAAAALGVLGLAIGLYVANRERAIAQRRFTEVRRLANRLIELDAEVRDLPGATKARRRIVSTSLEYLAALGPQAQGDKDLELEAGDAYLELARIQGVPIHSNLGEFGAANESLRKADALVESVLASEPENRRALLVSAQIAHDRMAIASVAREVPEALEQGHRAEAQLERLAKLGKLGPEEIGQMARIYANAAIAYSNGHRFEDCIRAARRGLEISRGVGSARGSRSLAVGALASALRWTGDLEGALATMRESRKILESMSNTGVAYRMNLYEALFREGRILGEDGEVSLDRPQEAVALIQRSMDLAEELAARDPGDTSSRHRVAAAGQALGDILRHSDAQRALASYEHGLARIREVRDNLDARRDEIFLLAGSAYALRRLHRDPEAGQRIDAALRILRDIKDYPAERIVPIDAPHAVVRALADHYAETGRVEKAADGYRELLDKVMASRPDPEHDLRNAKYISDDELALAGILRRLGRTQEAADLEARRQALWRGWERELPKNPFVQRQLAAARVD